LSAEEEKAGWELLPPEERPAYVPQAFDCLRHVPLYGDFIKERFERCLDLYLCPRCVNSHMTIAFVTFHV
jgi:ribosome biogenesis protein ERB1